MKRRRFLQVAAAGGGSAALLTGCGARVASTSNPKVPVVFSDPDWVELADIALTAARDAGASYADIRIANYRVQRVRTREQRVTSVSDSDSRGFGVRVIANGTWGFAASSVMERDEVAIVARRAVGVAKANAVLQREPVRLAAIDSHRAVWNTPIRKDPFEVSLSDKADALLAINAAAMAHDSVSFCSSRMAFVREHKLFASSEGSYIEQTLHRCNPGFRITSVDRKRGSFETRSSYSSPQGVGYEYIEDYPWLEDARQAAEDVRAKHSAPSVEPGRYDLILHPSHLWLTIHESIGHPTELDRAIGMEANFAGTSFLTPDKLGSFRLGSDIVNFRAEKTSPGALATSGYDDDGAKTVQWDLVKDGRFVDYQVTRDQAHWIGRSRGYACSYAQSWKDVPFQRMPNINLVPAAGGPALDGIVADTERGILIKGRGSYSIDHQRYNFQFGGQTFWKIENGTVAGMLRDVAYQARTPEFWRACDVVGGPSDYEVGGSFHDGKGEPAQSNAVSHGCPPARFRSINVLNTARKV